MLSHESIQAAKDLTLPDTDEVHVMTEYDRRIWQEAFDWYNKTYSPDFPYTLKCRHCYHKVYAALREAKKA